MRNHIAIALSLMAIPAFAQNTQPVPANPLSTWLRTAYTNNHNNILRSAEKMPWSERDARMWQIVFPNMAKWLPDDEAEQLRFEFAQEMERLKHAA